jgi:acyl-coenzyme A thioesterase PaaI-like protein
VSEAAVGAKARHRESWRIWVRRQLFNFYPAFWGTGAKVDYIAEDLRSIRIRLPLTFRTRNIHGTIFGGAMYAATDPLYALLIKAGLGRGYVVWDKHASIRYRKPGKSTLYAECSVTDGELEELRTRLESEPSVDASREIALVDAAGVVHAVIHKTVFVAKREAYRRKLEQAAGRETRA